MQARRQPVWAHRDEITSYASRSRRCNAIAATQVQRHLPPLLPPFRLAVPPASATTASPHRVSAHSSTPPSLRAPRIVRSYLLRHLADWSTLHLTLIELRRRPPHSIKPGKRCKIFSSREAAKTSDRARVHLTLMQFLGHRVNV